MPYELYNFLHIAGVILLTGFTFYAFAGPNVKTKKWVLGLAGLASLIVLVSGFAMQAKGSWGWPGWILIKIVAWLGISAFGGVAYRRRGLAGVLMLVTIVFVVAAAWAVIYKPF